MGDAFLAAEEAMHNFDTAAFHSNYVRLIGDDQLNGAVADVVPFIRYGGRPADPSWGAGNNTI